MLKPHVERRTWLTADEASFISRKTSEEEKLEFRSPDAISLNAKDGCAVATIEDQIVGCFFLRKYGNNLFHPDEQYHGDSLCDGQHVFERATLWVDPHFRKHSENWPKLVRSISTLLNEALMSYASDKLLVSISSNPTIVKRNTDKWMILVPRDTLITSHEELRNVLCEDDLDIVHGYKFMLSPAFNLWSD